MTKQELKNKIDEMTKELQRLNVIVATMPDTTATKWEPRGGSWFVDGAGEVSSYKRNDRISTKFVVERSTKEAAEKAAKQMRLHNRILAYVYEHAPDWNPTAGDAVYSVFVRYDGVAGIVSFSGGVYISVPTMPKEVAEKLADDINSGVFEI